MNKLKYDYNPLVPKIWTKLLEFKKAKCGCKFKRNKVYIKCLEHYEDKD